MFDVVKVKFLAGSSGRSHSADISYEYRVPDFLKGKVEVGMLGIVAWKDTGKTNPTVVEITKVGNVLDGEWTATDYADLIGVVSLEPFQVQREAERRRKRLLDLIEQEKQRVTTGLDLNQLAALSPKLGELVKELQGMDAPIETKTPPKAETYLDGDGFVHPVTQPSRDDGKTAF